MNGIFAFDIPEILRLLPFSSVSERSHRESSRWKGLLGCHGHWQWQISMVNRASLKTPFFAFLSWNFSNFHMQPFSYQIPPLISKKTAVVVSPLLSLMQDQVCFFP